LKTTFKSLFYQAILGKLVVRPAQFSEDVVNIEMESTIFAALTHHAGIKAAVVCVALLNRLNGDQVNAPKEVMHEWQQVGYLKICPPI